MGRGKNPNQQPFTKKEDYEILKAIMNVGGFHLVAGNSIWQSIERKKVSRHSWQAIKTHFHSEILPNINKFQLPTKVKELFKRGGEGGDEDSVERESEDSEYVERPKKKKLKRKTPRADTSTSSEERINPVGKNKRRRFKARVPDGDSSYAFSENSSRVSELSESQDDSDHGLILVLQHLPDNVVLLQTGEANHLVDSLD